MFGGCKASLKFLFKVAKNDKKAIRKLPEIVCESDMNMLKANVNN